MLHAIFLWIALIYVFIARSCSAIVRLWSSRQITPHRGQLTHSSNVRQSSRPLQKRLAAVTSHSVPGRHIFCVGSIFGEPKVVRNQLWQSHKRLRLCRWGQLGCWGLTAFSADQRSPPAVTELAMKTDKAAKAAARLVQSSCKVYISLLQQVLDRVRLRSKVDAFHLSMAFLTAGKQELDLTPPVDCRPLAPVGVPRFCCDDISVNLDFHGRFLRQVLGWFQGLSWYRVFSPGDVKDISWIEMYWEFVSCTGTLPPSLVDGQWVSVSDNDDAVCCVPPAI